MIDESFSHTWMGKLDMERHERFSSRFGHKPDANTPITIREGVPDDLRGYLVDLAYQCDILRDEVRSIVCRTLRISPDKLNNWGAENIDREIRIHLSNCEWYFIYDVVEALALYLQYYRGERYFDFHIEVNEFFLSSGVGWKLEQGQIIYRGDVALDRILSVAVAVENANGFRTASNELHEAIKDLSRRPSADVTGAIQHSMASLECIARDTTGGKETLGGWLKRNKNAFPPPLADVTEILWGFASNHGRHLKGAEEASLEEAELILGICGTLGSYLASKNKSQDNAIENPWISKNHIF